MRSLQRHLRFWYMLKRPKTSKEDANAELNLNTNMSPMRINDLINESSTESKLKNLLVQRGDGFSLVNISTFLKKYSELETREEDTNQLLAQLLEKKFKKASVQRNGARALANSLFYLSRIAGENEFGPAIDFLVGLDLQSLVELSNNKEAMMVVTSLCRLGRNYQVRELMPTIREKLATSNFSVTHLVMIWMTLLKHDLSDPDTDKLMDSLLSDLQANNMADYASLVYCYSKCNKSLIDEYSLRRLANYPKKDIFNIKQGDMSTLMYAIGNFQQFHADEHFHKVMLIKVAEFLPVANDRALTNMLHGIRDHLHKHPGLFQAFEDKICELIDLRSNPNPVDLESVTSMLMDLNRVQGGSERLLKAMEGLLLDCFLPEKAHRFINLKLKFIQRMLQIIKTHKLQHPEYSLSLDLRSGVQSYLCNIIPDLKQEQLLQLLNICNFIKNQQVCWAFIKAVETLSQRYQDSILSELDNRFCILGRVGCLNCRKSFQPL